MRVINYVFLGLGLTALLAGGCADNASVGTDSAPTNATITPRTAPALAESAPSPLVVENDVEKTAFIYPYPDREDIFSPPIKKPSTTPTRSREDEDVVLMGFANVGEAQAVLKIDGIVAPLRAGESHGDVRVLSIDPPNVSLQQRDRQWTESLVEPTYH